MKSQDKDIATNRGTFIAIAMCIALYLAWNQYLTNKYPGFTQRRDSVEQTSGTPGSSPSSTSTNATTTPAAGPATTAVTPESGIGNSVMAKPAVVQAMAPNDLVFDTKDIQFTFSQDIASLSSAKLKNYRDLNTSDSRVVELFARPAAIEAFAGAAPQRTLGLPFTGARTADGIKFTRVEDGWRIDQEWVLPKEGYAGKLLVTFTNTSQQPKPLMGSILTELGAATESGKSSFFAPGQPGEKPRFLSQIDGSDDFKNLEDFCKDQSLEVAVKNRKLDFYGFDTHYFAFALLPKAAATYRTVFSGRGAPNASLCEIATTSTTDLGMIGTGATAAINYDVWFGPKDVELLTAFNPRLKTTLGLGWLDMIAHPLLLSIKGLYKFTGNYGLGIILLTFLLKVLFFPLTKQAAHSAAKMKKLNPEMAKIRERLKNDPQKMQMELMKFMGAHKINPMKGCLPILPTIPVFFALFRVLSASIDLRHAPFYGWITDLSAKDPYLVTPIVLTGFMFIQQRMTPMTGMDKAQVRVMMFMPLIFGVMMITLPSGLVLYMLTNTIVSIVQQQYLNRKFANI
jgi:YidC/Oxa1 family membrane protein insertase